MNLLTITCDQDFPQMLFQAESIQKFLEPCDHYVIVNEDKPDLLRWYTNLKQYYTKHKLILLNRIDYDYDNFLTDIPLNKISIGWNLQQLQKLLFAYKTEEDYLILDSKNIFVKPSSLDEYDPFTGNMSQHLSTNEKDWGEANKYYARFFNKDPLDFVSRNTTPFKMDWDTIVKNEYFNYENIYHALNFPRYMNRKINISEFLFYDYATPSHKHVWIDESNNFPRSFVCVAGDYQNFNDLALNLVEQMQKCKIVGLSREIFHLMREKSEYKLHRNYINTNFKILGFGQQI